MRARGVHAALVVVQDALEVVPDRDEIGPRAALGEGVEDGLDVALRLEDADQNALGVVLKLENFVARVVTAVVPDVATVPLACGSSCG